MPARSKARQALASLGVSWNDPDEMAVAALRDSRVASKLFRVLSAAMAERVREAMRALLLEGPALGRHPLDVARDMQRQFADVLGSTQARMNNIARTEILDAYRAGGMATEMANTDVVTGWLWMSVLGFNTCPSCISMHGTEHPPDERGPDDHPMGRCFRMPLTKSWRDLGFNIDEPPSLVKDNSQWFNGLSEQQQRDILGPARYEAWKAGSYPMSEWAVRVENDNWRASYQVSPLK